MFWGRFTDLIGRLGAVFRSSACRVLTIAAFV
jgi:hypothetical protein